MTAAPNQTVDQARFASTRPLDLPPVIKLGLEFQRRGQQPPPKIGALLSEYQRRGIIGQGEVASTTAVRLGHQRLKQIEDRNEHVGSDEGRDRYVREQLDGWWDRQRTNYVQSERFNQQWQNQPIGIRLTQPKSMSYLPYAEREAFTSSLASASQKERKRLGQQYDQLHTPEAELQRQRDTAGAYLLENFKAHNPDATDQDAYDYMHDELARQGYQLPGVEKNAIVDREALRKKIAEIAHNADKTGFSNAVHFTRENVPYVGDVIAGAAGTLDRGVGEIASVAAFYTEAALGLDSGPNSGSAVLGKGTDRLLRNLGLDRGDPEAVNAGRRFAFDLGTAAGDIALILATRNPNAASRMAAVLPGSVYFGGREAGSMSRQAYDRYVQQGLDPRSAQIMAGSLGVASGTMTALLERIPLDEYFDPAKRTLFNRAVRGALAEGTTESAQELASIAISVGADVEDATTTEALARIAYAGAVGAVAGAASNTILPDEARIDTLENAARGDKNSRFLLTMDDAYRALSQRFTGLFARDGADTEAPDVTEQATETVEDEQGREVGRSDPKVLASGRHAAKWYAKTFNDPAGAEAIAAGVEQAGERLELVDVPVGQLETLVQQNSDLDPAKVQSISQLDDQSVGDLPPVIATKGPSGELLVLDGTHRTEGLRQRNPASIVRAYVPQSIAQSLRDGTYAIQKESGAGLSGGDQQAGPTGPGVQTGTGADEQAGAQGGVEPDVSTQSSTRRQELTSELDRYQKLIAEDDALPADSDEKMVPRSRQIIEGEIARLTTAIEQEGGQSPNTSRRGTQIGPEKQKTEKVRTGTPPSLSSLKGKGTTQAIQSAKARGRMPRRGEPLGTGRHTIAIDELTPSFIEGTLISPERVDYWRKRNHRTKTPFQVIEEADGTLMVRDGNHRLIASAIEGDTEVPIVIQRSDAKPYTGPERREADRTTIERPEGDDRASQIRRNFIDMQDDQGKPLTQETRQAMLKELADLQNQEAGLEEDVGAQPEPQTDKTGDTSPLETEPVTVDRLGYAGDVADFAKGFELDINGPIDAEALGMKLSGMVDNAADLNDFVNVLREMYPTISFQVPEGGSSTVRKKRLNAAMEALAMLPDANENGVVDDKKAETIDVLKPKGKSRTKVEINVIEGEDGLWTTGHDRSYSQGGSGSPISMYGPWYDSRAEAIEAELDSAQAYAQRLVDDRGPGTTVAEGRKMLKAIEDTRAKLKPAAAQPVTDEVDLVEEVGDGLNKGLQAKLRTIQKRVPSIAGVDLLHGKPTAKQEPDIGIQRLGNAQAPTAKTLTNAINDARVGYDKNADVRVYVYPSTDANRPTYAVDIYVAQPKDRSNASDQNDQEAGDQDQAGTGAEAQAEQDARQLEVGRGIGSPLGSPMFSPEPFKQWFKGSKAVDANGKPLTVYHGTGHDFKEFGRKNRSIGDPVLDNAYFFTTNPTSASGFAFTGGKSPRVIPAHLSLKNPLIVDMRGLTWQDAVGVIKAVNDGPPVADFEKVAEKYASETLGHLAKESIDANVRARLDAIARANKVYRGGHDGLILRGIGDSPGGGGFAGSLSLGIDDLIQKHVKSMTVKQLRGLYDAIVAPRSRLYHPYKKPKSKADWLEAVTHQVRGAASGTDAPRSAQEAAIKVVEDAGVDMSKWEMMLKGYNAGSQDVYVVLSPDQIRSAFDSRSGKKNDRITQIVGVAKAHSPVLAAQENTAEAVSERSTQSRPSATTAPLSGGRLAKPASANIVNPDAGKSRGTIGSPLTPASPTGFNADGVVPPDGSKKAPEVPLPAGWVPDTAQDPGKGRRGAAQRRPGDTKKGIGKSIERARQRAKRDRASVDAADNIYRIMRDLSRRLGAGQPGIGRAGSLGRTAAGFIRPETESLRLHKGSYITTQVHELGHLIHKLLFAPRGAKVNITSKQLNHLPKEIAPELVALGKELYGERRPVAGYKAEGWAEAIRMMVSSPDVLREKAPKTYQLVTQKLKTEYPETWLAIEDARVRLLNAIRFAETDPVDQFIAHDEEGFIARFSLRTLWDDIRIRMFDRYQRLTTMKRDLNLEDLPANVDPHILALRANGHISGDIKIAIDKGQFNPRDATRKPTGPSLTAILRPVKDNLRLWQNYMVARRALEKRSQGFVTLSQDPKLPAQTTNAKLESYIRRVEEAYPEFGDYFRERGEQRVVTNDQGQDTRTEAPDTVAAQFQAFNKWLIEDYAVAYGLISSDVAKLITSRNLEYITFRHKQTDDALSKKYGKNSSSGGFVNTGSGIRRFNQGKGEQLFPPLESFMASMQGIMSRARLNEAGNSVTNIYERGIPGSGRWLNKIDRPMDASVISADKLKGEIGKQLGISVEDGQIILPEYLENIPEQQLIGLIASIEAMTGATFWSAGNRTDRENQEISVLVDGTPKFYEVKDKRLFDLMEGMGSSGTGHALLRVAGIPSRVLRAGATQLNVSFSVPNLMRDTMQALTMTDSQLRELPANARTRLKAIREAFTGGEIADLFLASGADMSGIFGEFYNPGTKKINFDGMFEKNRLGLVKGDTAKRIIKDQLTLGPVSRLNESMEKAVRLGEFAVVHERMIGEGKSEAEALAAAGQAAADITLDFQRGGTWSKQINEIVVFFNAAMLGGDKLGRFIKKNPAKAFGRIALFTIMPSIISMAMNYDNEDYWSKPQGMRDRYWYFPLGDTDGGKPMYFRMPKPYGLGAFSVMTERMFQRLYGLDPETGKRGDRRAFRGLSSALIDEFRPAINFAGLLPIIEVTAGDQGYSFWRDNTIVSDADKDLPLYLQGATRSSELARVMGAELGYPPAKIDYLISGFFGGLGRDITDTIIDPPIRAVDPNAKKGKPVEFSDYLVIRRFVAGETTAGHEATTRFFEDYEELERVARGLKVYEDQPEQYDAYVARHAHELDLWPMYQSARSRISKSFSGLRSLYRRRGEIPADEFERQVDELYGRIITEAQQTRIIRNQTKE